MPNKKLTVSLSDPTLKVLAALREITDAYTDSEVVKNALYHHFNSLPPRLETGRSCSSSTPTKEG